MLIAVAGASGRLGRRFLLYCRQKGLPTLALLRSAQSAQSLPPETQYVVVGYEGSGGVHELMKALEGVSHIVNLTGSTDTTLFEDALFEANVVPTKALLEATPQTIERFVHVSSIAVYGKNPGGDIMDENSPKTPYSAYGRTKLDGEVVALSYSQKFPVVSLQPAIIYGPGFEDGFYPVLSALKNGRMQIIGDGKNRMPIVHCDDVADAIAKALTAPAPSGSCFVLTSEPVPTQNELVETAAKALNAPMPQKKASYGLSRAILSVSTFLSRFGGKRQTLTPEMLDQLYLDRPFTSRKALYSLGWKASIDFKTGVGQVVDEFNQKQ